MIRIVGIISLLLLGTFLAVGQERLLIPTVDSAGIDYRSNGASLDSTDAINVGAINLRPAGGFAQIYEHNLARNLYESPAGFSYLSSPYRTTVKRTPLPYLGFQYAFGAGNQAVNVDYHHFITEKSHYHFRYHRRVSDGLLRNSSFTLNDVHLLVHHQKKSWRTSLDAYYGGYDYEENGGITSDADIGVLDIDFIPVNKSNANSLVRKVDIYWQNYKDVYRDSILAHGFKHQTRYELVRRKFEEAPVLGVGYTNIFIDSNRTRDHFQTPSISNGVGYFFSSSFLEVDGTLNHRYWRNQNLGIYRDTTELFLHSNLWMKIAHLELRNEFYFNTLGALGEFYNRSSATLPLSSKFNVHGRLHFDNRLPLPYQRFHSANNLQWELAELNTQQILHIRGGASYGDKTKINADFNWTTVTNGLFFIDEEWRQDSIGAISVGDFTLSSSLKWRNFYFYPTVTLRFNTDNFAYQPAISTRNRIAFKKGFFEGESLIISYGLDVGYDFGHQHLMHNHLLNTMDITSLENVTPDLLRLNVFAAMEIDQFRLFLRAENVDYFINDPKARMDPNYTLMPFIMRLGVTWDFFN